MDSDDQRKPYRNRVMTLNAFRQMDEEEHKRDIRYATQLVMLFVVIPIIVLTVTDVTGHLLAGIALAASSAGTGLAIGLNKRRSIISNFYQVESAGQLIDLCEITDRAMLDELCEEQSVAFICTFDDESLTFIYNWLVAQHALDKGERLRAYRLAGKMLVKLLGRDLEASTNFLVVPSYALWLPQKHEKRFEHELPMVGGACLDRIVEAVVTGEPAAGDVPAEPAAERALETLSNKGQKLE